MDILDLSIMTSPQVGEVCQNSQRPCMAVLTLGALEQHGPHLPLATDSFIVQGVLEAALGRLAKEGGDGALLVLPHQSVGLSVEHSAFAGTMSLQAATALEAWFQTLSALPRWGVDRVFLFNGHGGQVGLIEVLAQRLRSELGMTAIWCHVDALGCPEGMIPDDERRIGLHGGLVETALMLAIAPQHVHMSQARRFDSRREAATADNIALRSGGCARHSWQAEDLNSEGVVGNAAAADASLGRKLLDHRAKALAQAIQEALTFRLNRC